MAATTEILKLMYAFPVKRHLPGRAGLIVAQVQRSKPLAEHRSQPP